MVVAMACWQRFLSDCKMNEQLVKPSHVYAYTIPENLVKIGSADTRFSISGYVLAVV